MDEFKLIEKLVRPVHDSQVYIAHGDDCSVVEYSETEYLISSTDLLVEGVHFNRGWTSSFDLGFKALAVNVSDISAMGGTPRWVHLSLAINKETQEADLEEFYKGFYQLADDLKISLVGGDMSSSPSSFFINVHISGVVKKKNLKLRRGFAQGDVLAVTGPLGDSAAGLYSLQHGLSSPESDLLKSRHFRPPVVSVEGKWLGEQAGVVGMMDLSDGLISDLQRIPKTGFSIELDNIPHSQTLIQFCERQKLNPHRFSIAGGEDYQLLVGCKQEDWASLSKEFEKNFNKPLYKIGKIKKDTSAVEWLEKGEKVVLPFKAFKHFSDAND